MLYFDRIYVSEGNELIKQIQVLNLSFKFQPNVCNRCHDLLMMSMNRSDIAILNIKGSDYRSHISLISKNEAINLMQNPDLTEKSEHYKSKIYKIG